MNYFSRCYTQLYMYILSGIWRGIPSFIFTAQQRFQQSCFIKDPCQNEVHLMYLIF